MTESFSKPTSNPSGPFAAFSSLSQTASTLTTPTPSSSSTNTSAAATASPSSSVANHVDLISQSRLIPRTSPERLRASPALTNDESPIDLSLPQLRHNVSRHVHTHSPQLNKKGKDEEPEKTYLYLGYGSNMSALSFLKRRNIKPISQINVVAPSIQLSFDLPGFPYIEPCFGNVRFRDTTTTAPTNPSPPSYHKNNWHKGLVGIVYEVTATDFAHILATEGGGASYLPLLVPCHALPSDPSLPVPLTPTSLPFTAYTLYSPPTPGISRPNPSYAQPSARYLALLTSGAEEHNLPSEYREYLAQIRPYTISTWGQKLALVAFLAVWGPVLIAVMFGLGKLVIRDDGTYPEWYKALVVRVVTAEWKSYDWVYRPVYGDGERSLGDDVDVDVDKSDRRNPNVGSKWDEKTPLLTRAADRNQRKNQLQWNEPGTVGGEEMV